MRESWGKGITYGGPLLTINLGISHVLLNWLTSPGAQKWLWTSGQARCLTNQITLGKGICHRREGTCLLAGSSESLHGSMEGTFHLRKSQGPWDTCVGWETGSDVSQFCISSLYFVFFKALLTL